jgi:hypothetical protein
VTGQQYDGAPPGEGGQSYEGAQQHVGRQAGAGPDHERFAFDDAAYVLGSLEPADRAAYEEHLAQCPLCQSEVAELSDLHGVLGRADPMAWAPEALPQTLLPRLIRRVRSEQRTRRWRTSLVAGAAACVITLLAVLGVAAVQRADDPKPHSFVALSAHASQIQAKVTLTDAKQRTWLRVVCRGEYDSIGGYPTTSAPTSGQPSDTGNYHVVVINRAGLRFDGGGWTPGGEVVYSTSAPWPERAISRIQIVDAHGVPLLQVVL